MEAAISFQEQDPLGRRGDPGMGKSIIFSLPVDRGHDFQCDEKHHFAIGTPSFLRLLNDWAGPIPSFDLFRAIMGAKETPRRSSRILSPFAEHQQRLLRRAVLPRQRDGADPKPFVGRKAPLSDRGGSGMRIRLRPRTVVLAWAAQQGVAPFE
jgi:hypothetical protein